MSQLILKHRLIQAPLAGYSCSAMRRLNWRYGGVDFCCSEMLSAKYLISSRHIKRRYQHIATDEGDVCIQLAGNNEDHLQRAAVEVASWGAQMIDLNCGCPMPKIRKKNYGSQLLSDSKLLARLIKAIKKECALPVLIKIRVDADSGDTYNSDVAKAAVDGGASAISIHGRHWHHRYDTPVFFDDIAAIKQQVPIPVIANGDIATSADAREMFNNTHCDAVMIGRACVGQPWLFAQIDSELQGKTFTPPSTDEIAALYIKHIMGLVELDGEYTALLQGRKLASHYLRHVFLPQAMGADEDRPQDLAKELQQKLISCKQLQPYCQIISEYFANLNSVKCR